MYKCHECQNDIKTDGIHHVLWRNSKEPCVLCSIKCVKEFLVLETLKVRDSHE